MYDEIPYKGNEYLRMQKCSSLDPPLERTTNLWSKKFLTEEMKDLDQILAWALFYGIK